MKILVLAENPSKIVDMFSSIPNIKIITEQEIIADTPYIHRFIQPGYSAYLTSRAANLSKIYKFNKPLVIIIDQRHGDAVEKIPHDKSVRVAEELVPRRLSSSVTYLVDEFYLENELTNSIIDDILNISYK